jgi:hypothetical protein
MMDVDYLVFARASWRLTEDKEWSATVKIVFDGGIAEEFYLTERGWQDFLKKLDYDEKYDLEES